MTSMPVQTALGDPDNAPAVTPDTVPAGCHWWTDPDNQLCLSPGCMARVQDPDAECTCDSLAIRLDRAQQQLRDLQSRQRYADTWWNALRAAVDASPDRDAILAATQRATGR